MCKDFPVSDTDAQFATPARRSDTAFACGICGPGRFCSFCSN